MQVPCKSSAAVDSVNTLKCIFFSRGEIQYPQGRQAHRPQQRLFKFVSHWFNQSIQAMTGSVCLCVCVSVHKSSSDAALPSIVWLILIIKPQNHLIRENIKAPGQDGESWRPLPPPPPLWTVYVHIEELSLISWCFNACLLSTKEGWKNN